MASVTIRIPSLLASLVRGESAFSVEASTIREALDEALRRHPELRLHLFDESGRFRQHVLCFHNQTDTRWLPDLGAAAADGDEITILQAVSGGARPRHGSCAARGTVSF